MKAIVKKDKTITLHRSVPNVIIDATGKPVMGISKLSIDKQNALGIYNLVRPPLGAREKLGTLIFDDKNKVVTYKVESIPLPPIEDLAADKRQELDALEKEIRQRLTEAAIDSVLEGNTTAAQQIVAVAKAAKTQALANIQGFVEANDTEGLEAYSVRGTKSEELFEAIENLKQNDD